MIQCYDNEVMSWQNISSAAKQIAKSDPHRAYLLYKMAIADCRDVNGAISLEMFSLFNDIAIICVSLGRETEARDYKERATSVKQDLQNVSGQVGIR